MGHRDIAIRSVRDQWDDPWDVYEIRPTVHPFPILLGKPHYRERGPDRRGGSRVIVTTELHDYLESCRYDRGSIRLPVGLTTIKRLRSLLGHNIFVDMPAWWQSHADELESLSRDEFADRHGFTVSRVSQVRVAMFGLADRPDGWWKQEPAASLLRGDSPRLDVADQLGISVGTVGRLRWVLRHRPDANSGGM